MKDKYLVAGCAFYVFMVIVVFGYSFNRDYEVETAYSHGANGFRALLCAMAWPMYLSKVAFEGSRNGND